MAAPVSMISFANELNGLIDFIERLFALGGKSADRLRRRSAGKAADTLHGLHFPPGGFRGPLENIASGKGSTSDIATLALFFDRTSQAVDGAVQALRAYMDVVRRQCGAGAAAKMEELLGGPDGKFVIRGEIRDLVLRAGDPSDADMQAQAQKILKMIAAFNAGLIDLHDMIFPPTGAPN